MKFNLLLSLVISLSSLIYLVVNRLNSSSLCQILPHLKPLKVRTEHGVEIELPYPTPDLEYRSNYHRVRLGARSN
jgi:hypothetical protein